MKFERISVNPEVMMGKPCIKGTRVTIELILEKLGSGYSYSDLIEAYPRIKEEDIAEAIRYAYALFVNEMDIQLTAA